MFLLGYTAQVAVLLKQLVIVLIVIISITNNAIADEFWNTGFEYSVNKQPRVWTIEGEGDSFISYTDKKTKHSGKQSLYLSLNKASTYIYISVEKDLLADKVLKAKGFIKLLSGVNLTVRLMLFDPGSKKVVDVSEPAKLDAPWQAIELNTRADASLNKGTYLLAFHIEGTGDLWIDDLSVLVNNQIFGQAEPDFSEPSKEDVQKLNKWALPVSLSDEKLTQYHPMSAIIGDAKIIGLGENSHGSATIYQYKLQLVKYLVKHKNVRVFALEMPLVEADDINDYVLSRSNSSVDVVSKLSYPSWQTEEMLSIIDWIKQYNKTAQQFVEFRGFDMQNGMSALNAIYPFLKANNKELSVKLLTLKQDIKTAEQKGGDFSVLLNKHKSFLQSLALFIQHHSSKSPIDDSDFASKNLDIKSSGIKSSNSIEYKANRPYIQTGRDLERYVMVLQQSLHFKASNYSSAVRDQYMAENIQFMTDKLKQGRIVISGDNTHVSRVTGSMGGYLSNQFDNDYFTIGITFQSGTYSAYGDKPYYEVHEPYVGTYEYFLSKSQYDNFILSFQQASGIYELKKVSGFRMIGSRPQEVTQFAKINIRQHFDAVLFLRHSAHTQKLK
ncbi:erythromycin esterase family protein [Pleionea mediterranea]|uniref:Erythromycin esterase-like protein n=1 Tax=Pleionea mediterranea TaxID=523701 RepID=A0A316FSV7_9GAMM|nr:erythromycin esterase family protein [Pleionea mediterranea]PWK50796.1 erythromycin esterase-like protein [Pleionea mediterranea]